MMIIKKVAVKNFRKFINPIMIDGLGPGINIVCGDNEDGKSTILEAVRAALHTKHSGTSQAIQSFQPYGSASLPEVELDFDLAGASYYIRKSFGKKGTAELREPDAVFSGSEAEERLQKLCLLGNENAKVRGIWNVLWVEQGTAFSSPSVDEIGKQTINSALENELGKIVSGGTSHALFKRISELYGQWFTAKNEKYSATSEVFKATKELTAITEEYNTKLQDYEQFKNDVEELQQCNVQLHEYEQTDALTKLKQAVESARKEQSSIKTKSLELQNLKETERAAQLNYQNVSLSFTSRRNLVSEQETNTRELAKAKEDLGSLRQKLDQLAVALHESQTAEAEADLAYADALAQMDEMEKAHVLVRQLARKTELATILEQADGLTKEAETLTATLQAHKVDRQAVDQLRQIESELQKTQAQLETIATKIQFMPQTGQSAKLNGSAVDPGQALIVTESSTFDLSGWGKIVVTPGVGTLDELRRKCANLQTSFSEALTKYGVASTTEAADSERERVKLKSDVDNINRSMRTLAPTGFDNLRKELASIDSLISKQSVDPSGLPSSQVLEAQIGEAKTRRDRLREQSTKTKAASTSSHSNFKDIDQRVQLLQGKVQTLESSTKLSGEKLAAERTSETDAALEQRVLEGRAKLDSAQRDREQLDNEIAQLKPEQIEATVSRLEQEAKTLEATVQALNTRRSELTGSLKTAGKSGIAEEFARISDKKVRAEALTIRHRKYAEAIKLLYNTLVAAESNSKQHLFKPFLNHLEPYVNTVFDGSKLMIDGSSFVINGLSRNQHEEPYSGLSLGTREQLSVLTRLAFANVLAENSCPAIVILDDALVYSDERRLSRMHDALVHASEKFQVIILTCRFRDWKDVPGHFVQLEDCQVEAASASTR